MSHKPTIREFVLLILLIMMTRSPAAANTFITSDDPGGPVFEWIDITNAEPVVLTAQGAAVIGLPFTFYYGEYFDSIGVAGWGLFDFGRFGALGFAHGNRPLVNFRDIQRDIPQHGVFPWWQNWQCDRFDPASDIWTKTVGEAPNRKFVLIWNRVYFNSVSPDWGPISFEVILDESDNSITFQYLNTSVGDYYWSDGKRATIGLTTGLGGERIQYLHWGGPASRLLHDELAVKFTLDDFPPAPPQLHRYAEFDPGYNVKGISVNGDLLYVIDGGFPGSGFRRWARIYQVSIPEGADPLQHPDNPDAPGPVAPRTFTEIAAPYDLSAYGATTAGSFAFQDTAIFFGPEPLVQWYSNPDGTFGDHIRTQSVSNNTLGPNLAYDEANNTFYAQRNPSNHFWVMRYHLDVDPDFSTTATYFPIYSRSKWLRHVRKEVGGVATAAGYLFAADRHASLIGQFEFTGPSYYTEIRQYYLPQDSVEGMTVGAHGHLWTYDPGSKKILEVGCSELSRELEFIPDQCIVAGELFDPVDLNQYVRGPAPHTWSYSGNSDLIVTIDPLGVAHVTIPEGWNGSETITLTVTDSQGQQYSDDVSYTVEGLHCLLPFPEWSYPFEPIDLKQYVDPACGVDPADVRWDIRGDPGWYGLKAKIDYSTMVLSLEYISDPSLVGILPLAAFKEICFGDRYELVQNLTITLAGCISSEVTKVDATPAANVTVKVLDQDGNQVGEPQITDASGDVSFDPLTAGTYSVMIVTPLGFAVSPSEVQDTIEVGGEPCATVDFVLTPTITHNECRSNGYWKHQFDVYVTGLGMAQESSEDLSTYLDLLPVHFDCLGVFPSLAEYDFAAAQEALTVPVDDPTTMMHQRARQRLFTLLMNFVSGRIANATVISTDDRTAAEAVTYTAMLVNNTDNADDQMVVDICDLINNGQYVEAGVIPVSNAVYKGQTATDDGNLPEEFSLGQNYPNPFNPATTIKYSLPERSHVTIEVFNLVGQKVTTVHEGTLEAGTHEFTWDGSSSASGVYFYRLTASDFVETRKMILLK